MSFVMNEIKRRQHEYLKNSKMKKITHIAAFIPKENSGKRSDLKIVTLNTFDNGYVLGWALENSGDDGVGDIYDFDTLKIRI
jgi:hypothetical protein